MNRQEFIDALGQRLSAEGFSTEYVESQCNALNDSLKARPDAAKYTNERNLDILVRKLIISDGHLIPQKPDAPAEAAVSEAKNPEAAAAEVTPEAAPGMPERPAEEQAVSDEPIETIDPKPSRSVASAPVSEDLIEDEPPVSGYRMNRPISLLNDYTPCSRPKLLTFLLFLICLPTIILVLTTAFGLFAGVFLGLAASIFFIVVAIIGIVGVGSVLSIGSLLYGATQILSSPRYVGFHEIGFGLIVAGITMASSILLYNLAIRWIPFITQQMGKLFKFFISKLISFAKNAVKGCEQL